MLAPETRTPLLEALRPPAGMELTSGLATTFTLDLTSALAAPMAFASQRLGSASDPIAVLQAISAVADRLDIFCQAGAIAVPQGAPDLVAYLERMVHPVVAPRAGGLFHPKVWVLEFGDEGGDRCYRLICGSRNLTRDRSWDVVLTLDGTRQSRLSRGNAELADFVRRLPELAIQPLDTERVTNIEALAEGIRRVEWDAPDDVDSIVFHPMGMDRRRTNIDLSGDRHLVISPFVNDAGIERVATGSKSVQVVSRVESLEGLEAATIDRIDQAYVLEDFTVTADDEPSEAAGPPALVGLHAKTYVIERGWAAHIFLGSANATDAALDRNVEMLVELVGTRARLGIATTVGDDAPLRRMLDPYEPQGGKSVDDEADRALERALRRAASVRLSARVTRSGELFRETVTAPTDIAQEGYTVTLSLLTRPGTSLEAQQRSLPFEGLVLTDITPFLVLEVSNAHGSRNTVVHAALTGDPPGRHDELLARQVDTPEKFLRFLALLLALADPAGGAALWSASGSGNEGAFRATTVGLFERLVRTFGQSPAALDKLSDLVLRLRKTQEGNAVMPAGFLELWDSLTVARQELRS